MSNAQQNLHSVNSKKISPRPRNRHGIGHYLLSQSWVTESDLLKAWSIQRYEQAAIGEILIGMGIITHEQLYWALGAQQNLEVISLLETPPTLEWSKYTDAKTSLKIGYILWRSTNHSLTFAITDPKSSETIRAKYAHTRKSIRFVLTQPSDLKSFIASNGCKSLQKNALNCCPEDMSCRSWSLWAQTRLVGLALLSIFVLGFVFASITTLEIILTIFMSALVLLIIFRTFCLFTLYTIKKHPVETPDPKLIIKRPKVSIIVPLYKEGRILKRLKNRLSKLSYPKELLEICFVYEEADAETKSILSALELPYHMITVEVPDGKLKTKPRAMNYALDFCTGSIIGIYDAEDAPEIMQIENVVQKFALADRNIACIQCVLDFYNSRTNWISLCFTIEYAILFRVILPTLDALQLPIPLGGTSVFFRRDVLEKLGRWDAYNVTEDADLGYRLYQMGYRCSWINAVTYEEANYRFIPWVKQRSRWLKGFLLTALVHFKNPLRLHKNIGSLAIFPMIVLTITPWLICPLIPFALPIWALSFGADIPLYSEIPRWFLNCLILTFLTSEIITMIMGFTATNTKQHKHLRPWVLTTVLYWPITSLASYKALYEFFLYPQYWDKSEHGLNDQRFIGDIKKLTDNSLENSNISMLREETKLLRRPPSTASQRHKTSGSSMQR